MTAVRTPPEVLRHRGSLEALPLVLWAWHGSHEVGRRLRVDVVAGEARWAARTLGDVLAGAGFERVSVRATASGASAVGSRSRSLADTVGPGMRLLLCGLNPSVVAADAGIPFVRPGNRFWPALAEAGLADAAHDPHRLLVHGGIGLTDLVKRATPVADGLGPDEYRRGLARLERLAAWLRPKALCLVGLAGWRAVVDRQAIPGWQATTLAGRPVYVMPSTSGRNARTPRSELARHLRTAAEGRLT